MLQSSEGIIPATPNDEMKTLLRLDHQDARVTEKTAAYQIRYLNPQALARWMRVQSYEQTVQEQNTVSFCKNEPLYFSREEAQKRSAELNTAMFGGKRFFHVVECWAVPVTPAYYPTQARLEADIASDHRELVAAGFETEAEADEADDFTRRVLGLD